MRRHQKERVMSDIPNLRRSPYYTDEHDAFRDTMRRFVEKEIEHNAHGWDEAEEFPRELYKKAAEVGLLQLGYPEKYGGITCDRFYNIIAAQELARAGAGGISASLMSHAIGTPHLTQFGSDELKARVLPSVLAGEKIAALAVAEPSGGSDVARLKTTARRDGDDYIVNGQKMFITSGCRADYYTVAVRTGGEGLGVVSLLMIEREREGFGRTKLSKMGWWASDTAALYFDDVRVPRANLIGNENEGFKAIMHNFNYERLGMYASALGCSDLPGRGQQLRQGAPHVRQTLDPESGDPPQAGGHGHADQFRHLVSRRPDLAGHAGRPGGGGRLHVNRCMPPRPWNSAPTRPSRFWAVPATCAAARSNASIAKPRSWPSAASRRKS
jgi:hypothetical protein